MVHVISLGAKENHGTVNPKRGQVFLNEEGARVTLGNAGDIKDELWYLDIGASNHMTGDREDFAKLDTGNTWRVHFEDGSVIEIRGPDAILFITQDYRHCILTNVHFIPRLGSNIISTGHLDEVRCEVTI